ncbi:hypothetical protein PAXRUDRAFT_615747 [Paxillus rubicundulus Ve08.2h10]|uniref:Uncharacterized protein n=1 Tax=Paxillus rubicundulus Ve08.2h10 TaxID=930991 RepID=A0A0D0E3P9_9AGAM|nr:hypothetical protein PAXRUDRAFT_615747 [Paxillus rubicundulus Ve08.2h10]
MRCSWAKLSTVMKRGITRATPVAVTWAYRNHNDTLRLVHPASKYYTSCLYVRNSMNQSFKRETGSVQIAFQHAVRVRL